jgi:endonuclease-3
MSGEPVKETSKKKLNTSAGRPRRERKSDKAPFPIERALDALAELAKTLEVPVVTLAAEVSHDPWEVLSACILSLRTKDAVTTLAVRKLFARARTPEETLAIPEGELAALIYPVGFYKTKAKVLREIARTLVSEHEGRVPDSMEGLLALKGVGRKTANLVLTQAFAKPGICVDTHVHRIMNRLGYVKTRSPDETETALRAKLPERYWIPVNPVLVAFGQGVCGPISPRCSACPIEALCPKKGVVHRR